MEEFVKKLSFKGDTFSDTAIRDMDFVLQRLLGNMQEKGAAEGSMTLKIDVSFDEETIPNYDPDIEGESRRIQKPKFKHTVSSTVTIKDKKTGNMDTEMEMVFDEDFGEYILKPIANTAQKTIFDDDIWEGMQDSGGFDEANDSDEGSKGTPLLPGSVEKDIVDVEVEETDEPEDPEDFEDVTNEILDKEDEGKDDYDYEDPEEEL